MHPVARRGCRLSSAASRLAASSRLTNAVAASLAIAALSLCLIVALTVLSTKLSMAMPLPL